MNTTLRNLTLTAITLASLCGSAIAAPQGDGMKPLATCNDGEVEYSRTGDHRGACSGHKGVQSWADGSAVHSSGHNTRYAKPVKGGK
jgi:hypothetical protein